MIKQETIPITILAGFLIVTVTGFAYADANIEAVLENHVGTVPDCFPVIDVYTDEIVSLCDLFVTSGDHTFVYLTLDGRIYDLDDQVTATLEQDLEETRAATDAVFEMNVFDENDSEVVDRVIVPVNEFPGLAKAAAVFTLDEKYEAGKFYRVTGAFATDRTLDNEAIESIEFYIRESDSIPTSDGTRISALENKTSTLESRTSVLEAAVASLPDMINSLKAATEAISERVEEIATSISSGPVPEPLPEPEPEPPLSGTVFRDSNGNGKLDPGESGASGMSVITVNLADFTDVNRTTTDENGRYSFELSAGGYLVQVEGVSSPTGYAYLNLPVDSTIVKNLGI